MTSDDPTPSPPLEEELLIECARSTNPSLADRASSRIAELVTDNVDWDRVETLAEEHGLSPWLFRAIKESKAPAHRVERLRTRYNQNATRNLFLCMQLVDAIRSLREQGIDAFPFKGPTLTESVYGDLSSREFSDLDVFIARENLARARDVLGQQGFVPDNDLEGRSEAAFLRVSHEFRMIGCGGRVVIELHWRLAPKYWPYGLDFAGLAERSVERPFGGELVRVFSPEDTLLILALHGAKHQWARLDWICCFAAWVRTHQEIDPAVALERATTAGCRRLLLLAWILSQEIVGLEVPDLIQRAIETEPSVATLAQRLKGMLFAQTDRDFDYSSLYFTMRERLRDRIPFFMFQIRRQWSRERERCPSSHPLAILGRPFRIVRRFGLLRVLRSLLRR